MTGMDGGRSAPTLPPGVPEALLDRMVGLDAEEARSTLATLKESGWTDLVDTAVRHGLGPLLALDVRRLSLTARVPSHALRRLEDLYLHSSLRSRSVRARLAEVLTALRAAEVETVVLKGAHLAEAVYPDAAARPMGDIDLLVR